MTDDLACAIREVVREFVNESTLDRLEHPTGPTSSPAPDPGLARGLHPLLVNLERTPSEEDP